MTDDPNTETDPDTPGGRLLAAAAEMIAIERGERVPSVERIYDGPVLVEVREHGEPTRRLADLRLNTEP